MKRTLAVAAAATVAFAISQYEWPGYRTRLAGGWLGVLGALALLGLASRLRGQYPRAPRAPRSMPVWVTRIWAAGQRLLIRLRRGTPNRPVNAELARMEGAVVECLSSASGVHRRLRPVVGDIVEDQLAMTSGLHVSRDAARVRALVGEELWELIRPDRPFPADGFAPGMSLAELSSLVDRLERLAEPR